jgi:hypothetical protein
MHKVHSFDSSRHANQNENVFLCLGAFEAYFSVAQKDGIVFYKLDSLSQEQHSLLTYPNLESSRFYYEVDGKAFLGIKSKDLPKLPKNIQISEFHSFDALFDYFFYLYEKDRISHFVFGLEITPLIDQFLIEDDGYFIQDLYEARSEINDFYNSESEDMYMKIIIWNSDLKTKK